VSNYPQTLLKAAFASLGDKTLPPQTAAQAGTGRFSQEEGFGEVNSTPLADGGIPPFREDMNGVLYLLSQFALWQQQGGLMQWSASLTYEVGNEILHNGVKYRCIQQCTNIVPPNRAYWKNLDVSVRAGMVIPAYNVTVDSNGHPIFWGDSVADEGFLLCDGRSDGLGGNVPSMIDRMIRGSTPTNAGQTGGADSVTLSVAQMPTHSHGVTVSTNGAHTHTRGSMNIQGSIVNNDDEPWGTADSFGSSGALSVETRTYAQGAAYGEAGGGISKLTFDAANSGAWTGETSQNGAHTHSITIVDAGSGNAVDIKNSFFTMAFFIKLPEV
jgi:microcystin-dependent protein